MFTLFSRTGYLRVLTTLLLMPLFKQCGERDLCTNYRYIFVTPVGVHLFSKCFEARLAGGLGVYLGAWPGQF